jgi:methylenetetrahydrofolate reductase (NADPH)
MIKEIFQKQDKTFSFEFFPPKSYGAAIEFGINVGKLIGLNPSFVSVTYGAGGSTHTTSFELCDFLQNKIGLTCMAHYTCVNTSREKIIADLDFLYERNIRNLMLLRGDPPKGDAAYFSRKSEFRYASDLVKVAFEQNRFCIGVAGYPEKHLESENLESDIQHLLIKVNNGADFIVTQMFFDNKYYFDFVERARKAGITMRIIPGIIPVTNFSQIKKFSQMCGATIPAEISELLEPCQNDSKKSYQTGVDLAIRQCEELLKNGAPGIHFYTLNKSQAALDIFASLPRNEVNGKKIKKTEDTVAGNDIH